jgi:hypothetical protein
MVSGVMDPAALQERPHCIAQTMTCQNGRQDEETGGNAALGGVV